MPTHRALLIGDAGTVEAEIPYVHEVLGGPSRVTFKMCFGAVRRTCSGPKEPRRSKPPATVKIRDRLESPNIQLSVAPVLRPCRRPLEHRQWIAKHGASGDSFSVTLYGGRRLQDEPLLTLLQHGAARF
jgi:hypothetical protein